MVGMKNPEKQKPLFLDGDGLGRVTIPKAWVEILDWKKGDKIKIICDLEKETICIEKK